MKAKFCIFTCFCLLALGVIGFFNPQEAPSEPQSAQDNIIKSTKKLEPLVLDNLSANIPVRDPFAPLVTAPVSGGSAGETEEGGGDLEPTLKLISIFQQDDHIFASIGDGKGVSDLVVGDSVGGYQVKQINLQENRVTLKRGDKELVLTGSSPIK